MMKAQFKNLANKLAPIFLMLVTMFICGCGCDTSKPTPDPLAGFYFSSLNNLDSNKAITDDYQDYLQKLSPKERNAGGYTKYFEDGTGRHAIKITRGVNGTVWEHVLIYDKDDKRIKTIKYSDGGYRS